ncbi:DUF2809 domain-containing protein [Occultella glacieicola]|nr:DUF2809 domain-containing protein [Occultella glacieicola]
MDRPSDAHTGDLPAAPPRPRRPVALALAAVVVVGLALQLVRDVPGSDLAGTAAYAVAAVLLVALIRPRWWAAMAGAVGTGAACAVELAQLTPGPGMISAALPPARLLLGANFDVVDLVTLAAAGAVTGLLLARSTPRPAARAGAGPINLARPDG